MVAVWESLIKDRDAKSMALGGTSAGGGLTLASTLRFKKLGLETPGALWAGTPWADLTKTGDSLFTNEGIDRNVVTYDGKLEGAAKLYADGRDLKTPLISPVYGEFKGYLASHRTHHAETDSEPKCGNTAEGCPAVL